MSERPVAARFDAEGRALYVVDFGIIRMTAKGAEPQPQCHPNGAAGLGPALNNMPLPEVAVRTQIHKGVGAMPSFDHILHDDEVGAIAAYVHALRETPAKR